MAFTPRTSYGNFGNSQWMQYAVARTGVAMPNCFTYATARISEIVGHNQSLDGANRVNGAGDLWEVHAPEFTQTSNAVPGDLAIYKGGYMNYGHVAVVEVVGANMAMSQSNYGGNLFDFVEVPKTPGSYYPGTALRLCGFLHHKELGNISGGGSGYSEKQLINENGIATLLYDVQKRRDSPTGLVVETLKKGRRLYYTQKWVGNGHRYISWVEKEPNGNQYRYFVAVSGSETQGQQPWAKFSADTPSKTELDGKATASDLHAGVALTDEHGWATLAQDVNKRRDNPNGLVVETLKKGKVLEYTQKCAYKGHRYVSWVETEPNGNKYRYFVAISGSETQGKDLWATFSATDPTKKTQTNDKSSQPKSSDNQPKNGDKPKDTKPEESTASVNTSNVKHWGIDISEAQGANFDVSKYDFVIIRASYGTNTDKFFETNVKKCEESKIPYGVYCYSYALDVEGAISEAKYIIDLIKGKNVQLGVWFDMEDADHYKEKRNCLDYPTLGTFCKNFCDTVKAHGYFTGIYSTPNWFELMGGLDGYNKWIALWGTNDGTYQSDTSILGSIHQYTSIPVDKNAMYVDFDYYKVNTPKDDKPSDTGTKNEPDNGSKEDKHTDDKPNDKPKDDIHYSLLDILIALLKKLLSIFRK